MLPILSSRYVMLICRITFTVMALFSTSVMSQQCSTDDTQRPASIEIRFKDFFKTPIGPAGLEISDTLREANGKSVCLVGYMVKQESPSIGRFFLTPLLLETHEHADGEADDLPASTVSVFLDTSQKDMLVPHRPGLLAIRGQLSVRRHEDAEGRISWFQIQLSPDKVQIQTAPSDQSTDPSVTNSHKH